jgi:hypothetical protein
MTDCKIDYDKNLLAKGCRLVMWPRTYPSEEMEMYPVSDMVNSPRNDTPDCIKDLGEHI